MHQNGVLLCVGGSWGWHQSDRLFSLRNVIDELFDCSLRVKLYMQFTAFEVILLALIRIRRLVQKRVILFVSMCCSGQVKRLKAIDRETNICVYLYVESRGVVSCCICKKD